jgi:hypothetical protein
MGRISQQGSGVRMSDLAEVFPCLVGKAGVRPWDPTKLDQWASGDKISGSELYAVRFVLNVWNNAHTWRCGRFDFLDALNHWDDTHRAAFALWAKDPWWP